MAPKKNTTEKTTKTRRLTGVVVSTKMKDTIVVRVDRYVKHPKYDKYFTKSKKFKAHDAGNEKHVGDKVTIEECPPISKDKHFRLIQGA
ncbi:MAG: 30S ribosomal protein S17 [bacterium]|nr:30S ribosomal protein S17 [bacterium]